MIVDWHPGRWWRVTYDGGRVWCETSDEEEARAALESAPGGGRLYRLYERSECEWRPEKR